MYTFLFLISQPNKIWEIGIRKKLNPKTELFNLMDWNNSGVFYIFDNIYFIIYLHT